MYRIYSFYYHTYNHRHSITPVTKSAGGELEMFTMTKKEINYFLNAFPCERKLKKNVSKFLSTFILCMRIKDYVNFRGRQVPGVFPSMILKNRIHLCK